jgi:NADPH:quinone reductase-like Zn-dependent oxidoreductase
MKAVIYNKKGSPEKLIFCETDKPVPNDNEVLIKVHAVALNAADYRSMKMGIIPKSKIYQERSKPSVKILLNLNPGMK